MAVSYKKLFLQLNKNKNGFIDGLSVSKRINEKHYKNTLLLKEKLV